MTSCFAPDKHRSLKRSTSRSEVDGRFNIIVDKIHAHPWHKSIIDKQKQASDNEEDDVQKPPKTANIHLRTHRNDFKPLVDSFSGTPRMNVAILIVGSRGDVQPYVALGKVLQAPPYNHRVRMCTHPNFKDFVQSNGLEFFSIGGDPEKLMAYMVKNPSVLPSLESMKAGDIGARRAEIAEMLTGCWRACTEAGNGIDPIVLPKLSAIDAHTAIDVPQPFIADAIISNPPAYANIHIAEKLHCPLHMTFTMRWSPTTAFSHPLATLKGSEKDQRLANFLSFHGMDFLTTEGLIDLVNDFRENTLGLDPIHATWGYRLMPELKVPFLYTWSPALIPKPKDWGPHIDISGFLFLESQSSFRPDADLLVFLDRGPPPIYIGFGSIVGDDPEKMTKMILDAVKQVGVRALVSRGWGNIGGTNVPDNVFLVGNVPHDWLFPHCSAVVHHGGAGTTAIGIALGLPTVVVPFFGDQPFWGDMIHRAGAGPQPIPYKSLDAEKLADQIRYALQPDIKARAQELSSRIKDETGTKTAASIFSRTKQMQDLNCFLCPDLVGVWRVRRTNIRLSALAVSILIDHGLIEYDKLKLFQKKRWYVEKGASSPLIGIIGTLGTTGIAYKNTFHQLGQSLSSSNNGAARVRFDGDGELERRPGVVKAVGKFGASLAMNTLRMPVDLLYNITNGCHNFPCYFDDTVRIRGEITGFGSGLRVGGQELCFGFYDAVTGLVTQPVRGYKKASGQGIGAETLGVVKGLGIGLGSFVCKSSAATLGVPGYGFKGLERSIRTGWKRTDRAEKTELFLKPWLKLTKEEREKLGHQQAREAILDLLLEAKGNDLDKQIRARRGWQGFAELQKLREDPKKAAAEEQNIIESWKRLTSTTR
ncbi:UDP-Glycosyltransferase/glycogen phosphorylase, partial [Aureobasidium melanogenum]